MKAMLRKKTRLLTRFLSWTPLEMIGIFSYSLYLIHAPLLHLVNLLVTRLLHPSEETMLAVLLLSIPAIVGVAKMFFALCEKPFMPKLPVPPSTSQIV